MDTMAVGVAISAKAWSYLLGTPCYTLGSWSQAEDISVARQGSLDSTSLLSLCLGLALWQSKAEARTLRCKAGGVSMGCCQPLPMSWCGT